MKLRLQLLDKRYCVVKLKPRMAIKPWMLDEPFSSVTRTKDELSLVISEELLGDHLDDIGKGEVFTGFKALKVVGPLDFSMIGILAEISGILAANNISIFVLSTFETDYILVNQEKVEVAVNVLEKNEIEVID